MNILGMGTMEILLILLIAFIVLGPEKMVDVARMLGKASRELRRMSADLPRLTLDEEKPEPPKMPAINRRSTRAAGVDGQDADTGAATRNDSTTGDGGPTTPKPDGDSTTDSDGSTPERREQS